MPHKHLSCSAEPPHLRPARCLCQDMPQAYEWQAVFPSYFTLLRAPQAVLCHRPPVTSAGCMAVSDAGATWNFHS